MDELYFENRLNGVFYTSGKHDYAYSIVDDNGTTATILKVFVDPELRGKGLAGDIMKRTIEYFSSLGRKIVPLCQYAVDYINKHGKKANR